MWRPRRESYYATFLVIAGMLRLSRSRGWHPVARLPRELRRAAAARLAGIIRQEGGLTRSDGIQFSRIEARGIPLTPIREKSGCLSGIIFWSL